MTSVICPSQSRRAFPLYSTMTATKILCSVSFVAILSSNSLSLPRVDAFLQPLSTRQNLQHSHAINRNRQSSILPTSLHAATTSSTIATKTRISINESYPGLEQIHQNPDIFLIHNFLPQQACTDLITRAKLKGTQRSPVAYAGWTDDIKDLLGLAASGPVSWGAILGAWYQAQGDDTATVLQLVVHALQNYALLFVLAAVVIAGYTKIRADGLQELRTSTSTTLDDLSGEGSGVREFVIRSSELFDGPPQESLSSTSTSNSDDGIASSPASYFEAPTVINYEKDQALAPHYDANRSASVEDANRGGQTLSTLLVYLNDVERGGTTRFGRLPALTSSNNDNIDEVQVKGDPNLNIIPRKGDALLFFPADQNGQFDERTEHEGCPAVDEKWIARIWRHEGRVPPPFGLSDDCIREHCS